MGIIGGRPPKQWSKQRGIWRLILGLKSGGAAVNCQAMKSRLRVPFLQDLARLALVSGVLLYPIAAQPAPAATPSELAQTIADHVEQYLVEAVGQEFDGEAVISVIPPAGPQSLEGCQDIQVYMPPGRKIRSHTTVG